MYIVVSFDFGGSSNVALHCCTSDIVMAEALYEKIAQSYVEYNSARDRDDDAAMRLVELVEVQDGFSSEEGLTLYWGNQVPFGRVLKTNNVPVE